MYKDRFEPPLKNMADAAMSSVRSLGIDAVDLAHADRQIDVTGLDHKVVMVVYKAVSIAKPVVPYENHTQGRKKVLPSL